jgi:hypothetical protein
MQQFLVKRETFKEFITRSRDDRNSSTMQGLLASSVSPEVYEQEKFTS